MVLDPPCFLLVKSLIPLHCPMLICPDTLQRIWMKIGGNSTPGHPASVPGGPGDDSDASSKVLGGFPLPKGERDTGVAIELPTA